MALMCPLKCLVLANVHTCMQASCCRAWYGLRLNSRVPTPLHMLAKYELES